MPSRLLREGIIDSDAVNSLTAHEEVFYRRLMSVVDDFGRFDGRVPILRSRLYALKPTTRETDIPHWIAACEKVGLILLYEVDGKPYILFHKLGQPRAEDSKYPDPPPEIICWRASVNGCAQMKTGAPYSDSSSESNSSSGSDARKNGTADKTKAIASRALQAAKRRGKGKTA